MAHEREDNRFDPNRDCPVCKIKCRDIKELKDDGKTFAKESDMEALESRVKTIESRRLPKWALAILAPLALLIITSVIGWGAWMNVETANTSKATAVLQSDMAKLLKYFDLEPTVTPSKE